MKKTLVLVALFGFLFFGIGNAQQVDTQSTAGWKITETKGSIQSASTVIIDTTSQSFDITLQNYDNNAYVMWGKGLSKSYTTPFAISIDFFFNGAGPDEYSAIYYQFSIGNNSGIHSVFQGYMDKRTSGWNEAGGDTSYYPGAPGSFDSIAIKIWTNGTYGGVKFRGIRLLYRSNVGGNIDSTVYINIFGDKTTAIDVSRETIPQTFELSQNYPNPFNPSTVISYQLSVYSHIKITVYDLLGREVVTLVNEEKPAGTYAVDFNGSNLSSGTYFYHIETSDGFSQTKKMILLR